VTGSAACRSTPRASGCHPQPQSALVTRQHSDLTACQPLATPGEHTPESHVRMNERCTGLALDAAAVVWPPRPRCPQPVTSGAAMHRCPTGHMCAAVRHGHSRGDSAAAGWPLSLQLRPENRDESPGCRATASNPFFTSAAAARAAELRPERIKS